MEEILATFDLVPIDAVMILVGAALFIVFWRTFGTLVVQPLANVVAERERMTIGADDRATVIRQEAHELHERFESLVTDARVSALKKKFDALAAAKAEGNRRISLAQKTADHTIESAKKAAQARLHELRSQVAREADGLAAAFAEKARDLITDPGAKLMLAALVIHSALLSPEYALAAGPSGHHSTPPPFIDFVASLSLYYFNFALYCLILFLVLRKPLQRAFAARRAAIEDKVLAGARALSAAEQERAEAQSKLTHVENEIAKIQSVIAAETENEVQRIRNDTEAAIARIEQLAASSAAAEMHAVEATVREELIESALLLARERLKAQNTSDEDRPLRTSAARKVGQLVASQAMH
jgi:F0F1-type ATP synthase membrane subunit b/b'